LTFGLFSGFRLAAETLRSITGYAESSVRLDQWRKSRGKCTNLQRNILFLVVTKVEDSAIPPNLIDQEICVSATG
jgi:hypothetical protein